MLQFVNTRIESLCVHQVGNRILDEGVVYSKTPMIITNEDEKIFLNFFLSQYKNDQVYHFTHNSSIKLNEVYMYTKSIFKDPKNIFEESVNIAKHLYKCSNHPIIKMGELFIVFFSNCLYNGETTNALGVFKSEQKVPFLKILNKKNDLTINTELGLNCEKIEKGCLIINKNDSTGFIISLIGSIKSNEVQFWKEEFLNITPVEDEFHQTNQFLSITKNFITKQFPTDFETTKADQIDLLNRSVEYFKTHETFDKQEFEKEVFHHDNIISSFNDFNKSYRQENDIDIADDFEISKQAVKKQERTFKSVLKLDKNFHIYIHGDKNFIEKGVEKDGRKYYKIYYQEES